MMKLEKTLIELMALVGALSAQAIEVGETITWTNTGKGLTAAYGGYSAQSLALPATAELPAGSVVKIKKITLAQDRAFAPDGTPYNYYVIEGLGADGTSKQASDQVVRGEGDPLCGTSGHVNIVYNYSTAPEVVVGKGYTAYLRSGASGTAKNQTQRMCVFLTKDASSSAIDTTNGSYEYAAAYVIEAEVVSVATAAKPAKTIAINFNATAKDNNEAGGNDAWKLADSEEVSVLDWTIPGAAWLQVVDKDNESGIAVPKQWVPGSGTTDLTGVTVTWSSNNNYMRREASTPYIMGYLDDGGNHAQVTVSGIPYKAYDVTIVHATDTENRKFSPVTVNGVKYTYKNGVVETTTNDADTWGASQKYVAEYGVNAVKVAKQSGTLSIVGGGSANNARGGIAAVIITEATADVIDANDVLSVSAANDLGQADIINLHLAEGAVFTIDAAPSRTYNLIATGAVTVKVAQGYTPTAADFAKLTFGDAPLATLEIATAEEDTAAAAVSPAKKFLYATTTLETSAKGNVYTAGAGSSEQRVNFTQNVDNGIMKLTGTMPYYLGQTYTGLASTVDFESVTLYATDPNAEAHGFGVGHGTYTFSGNTTLEAAKFVLSQGAAGRTSVFTMKDDSSVTVTGESNVDSNQSTIMFGHWAGPSTFTIKDRATFTSEKAQILMGKTANTQIINVEGGVMKVKGIKNSAGAGTSTLNLKGGTLELGDVGIDTYAANKTITVNVESATVIKTDAAIVPITQNITGDGAITKQGEGTLKIQNVNHGTLGAIEAGKVQFVATANEIADGKIVLKTTQSSYAEGTIEVVNESGEKLDIRVDINENVMTLSFATNTVTESSASASWTHLTGDVSVKSPTDEPMTITISTLPDGITSINVFGEVTLTFAENAVASDLPINVKPEAVLKLTTANKNPIVVSDGAQLVTVGTFATDARITSKNTMVESGVLTIAGETQLTGTITIKSGATLKLAKHEGLSNGVTLHNYGVFDLDEYNQQANSYNAQCKYYLYAGSMICGGVNGKLQTTGGYATEFYIKDSAESQNKMVVIDAKTKHALYDVNVTYVVDSGVGFKLLKASENNNIFVSGANIRGLELDCSKRVNLANNNRCLHGEVTIKSGTTLVLQGGDMIPYQATNDFVLNLYGTLECGETRQTLSAEGGNNVINLFDGARFTGTGAANGGYTSILDIFQDQLFTVSGTVTIEGPIGLRNATKLQVAPAEGATTAKLVLTQDLLGNANAKIDLQPGSQVQLPSSVDASKVVTTARGWMIASKSAAEEGQTVYRTVPKFFTISIR